MTFNPYAPATTYDNENDGYPEFQEAVTKRFNSFTSLDHKLFTTNTPELYEIFLINLPAVARQHYVCNACRHFFNRYGNLVAISHEGATASVFWNEEDVPVLFAQAVKAMREHVENAKVTGVFLSSQKTLGIPVTGSWTHLAVELPREHLHRSSLLSDGQAMAEKKQDFLILGNSLRDYSLEHVDQALALIQTETMYRSEKVLGVAAWFREVILKRDSIADSRRKSNIVWLAVAHAPAGFTHVRSSMIGTLLDDIKDGLSARSISARFAEKMNPANYMRSQAAPTQNGIYEAEKMVEKLGIANSLARRYATLEEIPQMAWSPRAVVSAPALAAVSSVFGHLTPKDRPAGSTLALPTSVMTWDKFQRTVLPAADGLEVLTDNPNRFMALVTAADETAPNIMQWDNPFSWYYHGGVDGEIKRRVEQAGGRYENNEIRVSLIWEGYTDLDLHAYTPRGEHIYFSSKRDRLGGYLDIDANGGSGKTVTPVENIRWASNAPEGNYRFRVHNFAERGKGTTPFTVELEVNGQVHTYNGVAGSTGFTEDVFEFSYVKGRELVLNGNKAYGSAVGWDAPTGEFVKVNAIVDSPNLWNRSTPNHSGTHTFFLLDGVKDLSEGKGRGFFNEMLTPELREIRKTLELFTANTPIAGADQATACGVGYSKDNEWNLTLKVKSGSTSRVIKIDRWD